MESWLNQPSLTSSWLSLCRIWYRASDSVQKGPKRIQLSRYFQPWHHLVKAKPHNGSSLKTLKIPSKDSKPLFSSSIDSSVLINQTPVRRATHSQDFNPASLYPIMIFPCLKTTPLSADPSMALTQNQKKLIKSHCSFPLNYNKQPFMSVQLPRTPQFINQRKRTQGHKAQMKLKNTHYRKLSPT